MEKTSTRKKLTRGRAIYLNCRDCLCLRGNERGYDCERGFDIEKPEGERGCPFYPFMPWRGKPMPKGLRPENEQ